MRINPIVIVVVATALAFLGAPLAASAQSTLVVREPAPYAPAGSSELNGAPAPSVVQLPAQLFDTTVASSALRTIDPASPESITAPSPDASTAVVELPLQEFVFLAQTSNPALQEASAKVRVAQGQALQVGMYPNPTFYTGSPQWTGSISQYNWFLGQDIITGGKLRLNRAAGLRSVEQAQLDLTRVRFEVMTAVRRQFYVTAAAQQRMETLAQLRQISTRSRDLGEKLFKAGETNEADATLLDIEKDQTEITYQNSVAAFLAARRQLAAVVGIPEMTIDRLQFDLATALPAYDHEALRRGVVDQNSLAAIAVVEIQKTQTQLRRAVIEPRPNFNIQAGYQYSVEGPHNDQGYAQFAMTMPLWNRNQGGIRAAQAETVRATAALQRVENELSEQVARALGEYAAAVERVAIYEERLLPKAREVFKINQSLFEQGQTDSLRLLQSQRTLIEADLGYLNAQEARWTAAATIAGLLQLEEFP